jgi:hypothetical protein
LYDTIIGKSEALVCYYLHDTYTEKPVQGVKIYNHQIFKQFPYDLNNPSCEVEQLARLLKAGNQIWIDKSQIVVGTHSPKWTPKGIFLRNYANVRKQIYFGNAWGFGNIEKTALLKLNRTFSYSNLFGYLGAVCAKKFKKEEINTEKNFKVPNPDYEALAKIFPGVENDIPVVARKLKVVQLARIPCANSGYYLSQLLNKYSAQYESRYILGHEYSATSAAVAFRKFPTDLYWQTQEAECIRTIQEADIVHIHHDFWSEVPKIKRLLANKRVLVTVYDLSLKGNDLYFIRQNTVAQLLTVADQPAQRRIFGDMTTHFVPLVNMLFNENNEFIMPIMPHIVYAPTNRYPISNGSSKGFYEVTAIIKELQKEGLKFTFDLIEGVSHEEDLNRKRKAQIIIDDIINDTWHNTSLQAACFGAISLTGSSTPEYPFVQANLQNLKMKLKYFIENPEALNKARCEIIAWRQNHYTPEILVRKIEDIYMAV